MNHRPEVNLYNTSVDDFTAINHRSTERPGTSLQKAHNMFSTHQQLETTSLNGNVLKKKANQDHQTHMSVTPSKSANENTKALTKNKSQMISTEN